MLSVLSLAVGVLWGAWWAHKLGGKPFDIAHYSAVFGLLCFVLTTFAGIVLARLLSL